jgi:CheY-like chemotaxis protein
LSAVGNHPRILVIDDEAAVLKAYRRLLRDRYDVVIAEGGAAGIACLARDQGFALVLCDLLMPQVDGQEVFEAAPAALRGRFVFASGGAHTDRARAFLARVENPVLDKPIDFATLAELIDRITRSELH